jgi:outer membrane receptor protein involved in Fe transport
MFSMRRPAFVEILLVILLLLPAGASAQPNVFIGRVIHSDSGQPVAGAIVTLAGLPGTVKTDADGRFIWNAPPASPFQIILVSQVRVSLVADDARPGPSEVPMPGARVVDLSGGWRVTAGLELRAIVRNLLDEAYYASPDPRWVYAPGRSVSITLGFELP